jgi:hypothetical protein
MKKIIYFYGISAHSLLCAILLTNPNLYVDLDYHYGALKIEYNPCDSKKLGKAIAKAHKRDNFRRTWNP